MRLGRRPSPPRLTQLVIVHTLEKNKINFYMSVTVFKTKPTGEKSIDHFMLRQ